MKIILTNDDGIYSPGILTLKKELMSLGAVTVVAAGCAEKWCGAFDKPSVIP